MKTVHVISEQNKTLCGQYLADLVALDGELNLTDDAYKSTCITCVDVSIQMLDNNRARYSSQLDRLTRVKP